MSFIKALGSYLPAQLLTNVELAARLRCDQNWIAHTSGIQERRIAAPEETVSVLGLLAARDCLSRAGVDAASLGLVIVSSGSGERRFPGPAAQIARELQIPGIPAIDIPSPSSGGLFGLVLADKLAYTYGHVLVIAAERMSGIAQQEPIDRNVAILFGDGAGAALVSPHEGQIAIFGHVIHSDGSFEKDLYLDFTGPLKMDGLSVILQSSRKLPAAILEVLDKTGYTPSDVEAFILHQANQNLTIRIARSLGISEQRFFSNIHKYGNTSSASMMIAAAEWMYNASIARDGLVVFAAFGAGFHWGALIGRRSSDKSVTAVI